MKYPYSPPEVDHCHLIAIRIHKQVLKPSSRGH